MRILIVNFYSPKNLGDLAILEQTVWLARQVVPDVSFDVLVSDARWMPHWLGVNWLPSWPAVVQRRAGLRALREAHQRADLILSLGGGYFFVHDFRPFSTWATVSLAYALRWRKPVICLPQSFGPFRFAYQARLAAALMARCDAVYLRDLESVSLFRCFAPHNAQAHFAPDTAFSLALRWSNETVCPSSRPQVGATAVDWSHVDPALRPHQPTYEAALVSALRHARKEFGAQINLFLQCQSARRTFESDLAVTRRIYNQLEDIASDVRLVDDLSTPHQALQAYAAMQAFVATRLHSAIFAACMGVPVLAIGYQPKACAAMHLLGQSEHCLPLHKADHETLRAKLDQLWAQRDSLGAAIAERASTLGQAAAKCITDTIARYLGK